MILFDSITETGSKNSKESSLAQSMYIIAPTAPASSGPTPPANSSPTALYSGQFLPVGTLLQTGGDLDGLRRFRTFSPCAPNLPCDWRDLHAPLLAVGRWYATNQILPDGSIIIVGGRAAPSVEFYPPSRPYHLFPFLAAAEDSQMDNLYPFVHLLPDGDLFVFANSRAVLYDADSGAVIRDTLRYLAGRGATPPLAHLRCSPLTSPEAAIYTPK
ncbi:hypothetical protein M5K25_006329 [Dendrobium thyrsiflorum]|uniref:Glyoxal oxidase N-terminal domain-containing protein n=1 Tax=Dendrobium thyrsiflorum TaxID=117978 RepID=A0ABD0VCI8_DENTH